MGRFRFVWGLWLGVCLFALWGAGVVYARGIAAPAVVDPRHVDGAGLGAPIDLSSTWLLQQGDDPRYANPNFDDSQWMVVEANKPLKDYGLKDVDRVWYRVHVRLPPGSKDLAVLVRKFGGSYELFVNGVQVGSSGPHASGGTMKRYEDAVFKIPDAAIQSGDVTVAVRASIGRRGEGGVRIAGFADGSALLLGPSQTLSEATALHRFRAFTMGTANILIELLIPLIALALALALPKEREYAALVVSGGASACTDILHQWQSVANVPPSDGQFVLDGVLNGIAIIAMLEFVRLALGLRRSRWLTGYEIVAASVFVPLQILVNHVFFFGAGVTTGAFLVATNLIFLVVSAPFLVGIPIFTLWIWWKRRNPDALLLFVPFLIQSMVIYAGIGLFIAFSFHLTKLSQLPPVPTRAISVQWVDLDNILFSVALLLFLVLRTVRIARSRAAMATDLHAVQSVQEILLARASHPTPGFRVEHVYHPASEVGGDFFLVSPGPDGALTAVVGDVSGKGLVAAMRVAMILGVLRRDEHREQEEVMRNLNEALLMQGEMGFTTACCVRLERDGHYTIANAGHISPYVGGEEILTPASLPLGMVAGEVYEQVSGVLPEGQTLVLMSDGVVEARSAKGELYGFERLKKLTTMSAVDIADVARRFGQEDDITVLTMACGA